MSKYLNLRSMLVRSFLVTILLRLCLCVSAQGYGEEKVTLLASNVSLASVLKNIERQTQKRFNYSENEFNINEKVNVNYHESSLHLVLEELFSNRGITWKVIDNGIYLRKGVDVTTAGAIKDSGAAVAGITITGRVTDEKTLPLIGATIKIANSKQGTITDVNGRFRLQGVPPNAIMIISFTGFVEEKIALKNRSTFSVALKTAISSLDETVVIAYGTTTQRYNTGSVSRVSSKEIARQPVSNPLLALQGRVPGLLVSSESGLPGATVKVQLRGPNSLFNGSDPLFIIDGVPLASGNQGVNNGGIISPFYSFGNGSSGNVVSPFSSINADDIESIEVLKDADATAIYGSRGANGVILITTKKGKAGKTSFNASVYSGITESTRSPKLLNTKEYLEVRRKAFENDGLTPTPDIAYDLLTWDTTRNTDWQKLIFGHRANTTNATASVNGGSENTQFSFGSGYRHDGTIFKGDGSNDRISFNTNVGHQSNNRKFSIELSALYSSNKINMTQGANSLLPPNAPPIYDTSGQLNWGPPGAPFTNPIAQLYNKYELKTDNLISSLELSYSITADLKFKTRIGYNTISSNETGLQPLKAQDPNLNSVLVGSAQFANTNFKSWSIEPQLEYAKKVWHGELTALLGGSWQKNQGYSLNTFATGYTNDALLKSLSAAPIIQSVNNSYNEYKYAAMFGRITYNLNDKYLANFSGRRDGSSRFGPGRRYSNFGAIGMAWVISNENFIKEKVPGLSYAKLRGSYGVTGNDQIGDYKYLDAWSSILQLPYQGSTTLTPEGLFNKNYNWERNRKLEAAVELGFWDNKLLTTASYYRNRCDNQLVLYSLPAQTGFSYVTANLPALIQNSGIEISISGDILSSRNFKWSVNGNITLPNNKILSFPDILTSPYAATYTSGQSMNIVKGYHSNGINEKGVYTFADLNDDKSLNTKDYVTIGSLDPKYYGGLNNHFSFKGLELDVFLEFKKQLGRNYLYWIYTNNSASPGFMFNQPSEILSSKNEVQQFTTSTTSDAYQQIDNIRKSDAAYSDASYIRLKNVSLSYNLPSNLKNNIKISKIFIQGQNLFVITRYKVADPETQNFLLIPPLRTISAGIQVAF
jgi:TonB-linked SusC/RagA family outer membrane protein